MSSFEGRARLLQSDSIIQETLELLEWPRLCKHLAEFASTRNGHLNCINYDLPTDLTTSRRRLVETLEMISLDELIEGGLSFHGVHDLEDSLNRCGKGGALSGEELLAVAETLAAARRIRRQVNESDQTPTISCLLRDLKILPELERCLKSGLEEGGRVADRASEKLLRLRLEWKKLSSERHDLLKESLRNFAPFLQDTLITERNARPVIAIKATATYNVPGLVHDSSTSGNTVFVEPQSIISLGNQLVVLKTSIVNEERRLLTSWTLMVAEKRRLINYVCEVLLQLDLALARARYGKWMGGVPAKLKLDCDSPFVFQELRHPLLVWQQRDLQSEPVIPISIEVPTDVRVVAITGPNTGGKTVTLKSIGLAVLMARAGLLIPCKGSPTLPWCSQVLADIGDEQSLQQNLSTFSGHIKRISRIIDSLSESSGTSLVLLDEVGAGTDPSEGSALAIALLKTFAEKTRLTIATTHFGELKALKYTDNRFENASVTFDSETMSPTYRLQWGIPGKSNAIAIAERLGLAEEVICNAKELLGSKSLDEVNSVISGLEKQRERQQVAAEEAAALLARTELLHEELLRRWDQECKQSLDLQEQGRLKLQSSISEGQKEVSKLIRRLRDNGADGNTARTIGQRLRRISDKHQPLLERERNPISSWRPKVGERVRLLALGKAAEVMAISDDGKQLTIRCGVLRSTVDWSAVESLDGRKSTFPEAEVSVQITSFLRPSSHLRTSRNTIDVRGLRVDEAEVVLEENLRSATGPIWVIHGIGTGRLKRGIRRWLDSVSYVEKVVDAEQADGGVGCTVVWLQ